MTEHEVNVLFHCEIKVDNLQIVMNVTMMMMMMMIDIFNNVLANVSIQPLPHKHLDFYA